MNWKGLGRIFWHTVRHHPRIHMTDKENHYEEQQYSPLLMTNETKKLYMNSELNF